MAEIFCGDKEGASHGPGGSAREGWVTAAPRTGEAEGLGSGGWHQVRPETGGRVGSPRASEITGSLPDFSSRAMGLNI